MKIISWNVNGLQAAWGHGLPTFIEKQKADIYAFQETKRHTPFKPAEVTGYFAYWSCHNSHKGYSGTLCLTKAMPLSVQYDMGDEEFDCEGRLIVMEYPAFYFVNCYVPNSQGSKARYDYRNEWDTRFREYVSRLSEKKPVIICGDFNVAVSDDDIYPENKWIEINSEGYMSTEREAMLALMGDGFVDSYRHLHPDERGKYSWWANRNNKRSENKGWRLDYALVSEALSEKIREATLLTEVMGSDHCPVLLGMDMQLPTVKPKTKRKSRKQTTYFLGSGRNTLLYEMAYRDLAYVWEHTDWEAAEENLASMQRSLAKVAYSRDMEQIAKWQKRIVFSLDAKLLAVRHICSSASKPGIDNVMWRTPKEKMSAVLALTSKGYKPQPSRLLLVKSKNGKQRRVHLETWHDRAMQTLYAFSLDPVSESWADRKSFAFRKGRSTFDLNEYIKLAFSGSEMPDWAFVGDVRQCYEHISHDWILEHIPMEKNLLYEFLKAGYVFAGDLFPTEIGVGIGLTLSPIIANMVLDGLQEFVYSKLYPNGQITDYHNGNVLRYADDIIIAARTQEEAERMGEILSEFLFQRGLELSSKKSRVVDMTEGFSFMSRFYIKKDGILRVSPSEESISRFMTSIKDTIENHTGSQQGLITKLNRKIDGWTTYHKAEDSYDEFRRLDVFIKGILLKSCEEKHPKWSRDKILEKYWYKEQNGVYVYALPDKKEVRVKAIADTLLICHDKVKTNVNPYIELDYVESREEERAIQNITGLYRSIWNRQDGKCHYCGRRILKDQEKTVVEVRPDLPRKASRLAYAHCRCVGCHLEEYNTDTLPDSAEELSVLLDSLQNDKRPKGQKFLPLFEYFRTCTKSPVTLTFAEMEKILGYKLGKGQDTKQYWLRTGFMNISQAWIENGYEIMHLHLDKKYIVFRQTEKKLVSLDIPDVFLNTRIPVEAQHELKSYFDYIIDKYGL